MDHVNHVSIDIVIFTDSSICHVLRRLSGVTCAKFSNDHFIKNSERAVNIAVNIAVNKIDIYELDTAIHVIA